MQWRTEFYVDYRSVFARPPLFFSAAADAIELAVKESRFDHFFHYIDDFVLLGLPGSVKCERGLLCLQQVCENLGFFFRSFKFDTQVMVLRLPAEKLERPQSLLAEWHTRCLGRLLGDGVPGLHHAAREHLLPQTQKFKAKSS